jgi:hypothetical protein
MADAKDLTDPEVNSQFAASKRLAKEKGTAPGIDPVTGERAAVTYRQLFNETGDEQVAKKIFEDVARAGGFGNVDLNQTLDIRSLEHSAKAHKKSAESGIDFTDGSELDPYGKHHHQQAAQHQDNLINAVGEALERLKKG